MDENLIYKYVSNQTNEQEEKLLRKWISESETREKEIARIKNVWILSGINNELDPKVRNQEINRIMSQIKVLNQREKAPVIWLKRIQYAAAIIILVVVSGAVGYFLPSSDYSNSQYTEFIVPKGERSELVLPDGSHVKLNNGTSLKFKQSFLGKKRKVILDGEAFFEVKHDKSRPFVVQTSEMEVEVLGTVFNVTAYADDDIFSTYLESGKVKVNFQDKNELILKPSEMISLNKASGNITKTSLANQHITDWTKGILTISGEPIENFAKKLERWYNIKIVFGDEDVKSHKYSGTIKSESLEVMLEALSYASSIDYKKNGNEITIYSSK